MAKIYYLSDPFVKNDVTLALESGCDGLLVPSEECAHVAKLARCEVYAANDCTFISLSGKQDEEKALEELAMGKQVILRRGWEVIPVENLLAQSNSLWVEVATLDEAKLANGILERGVAGIVVLQEGLGVLKEIVNAVRVSKQDETLVPAIITKIQNVGLGHRVCVDTLTLMHKGQGMLVGNSSAFTFLVHAETEHNEYVAARPFRINAGGVHAYTRLAKDRTCYLEEIRQGSEVLLCDYAGHTQIAIVGRSKIEIRPMLLIEAMVETDQGNCHGAVFLQNAETIRLTTKDGEPVSVVCLQVGDQVLCRTDALGRHFGMRISEDIKEL